MTVINLAAVSYLFLLGTSAALAQASGTDRPAVYTAQQAAEGGRVYASQCASCHGTQLEGNIGPAMTGSQFQQMAAAQQLTGASLLGVISQSMPKSTPGSLTAAQYASVTAFILSHNGFSSGTTPLTAADPHLQTLSLSQLPSASH
jgi:mono/diheme cytochrome c family protein